MAELLFSANLWYGLAAGGVLCAVFAAFGKKGTGLWGLLCGLCVVGNILSGLLQGRTLVEHLPVVLAVTAAALAGLCGEGGGGA